MTTNIKNYTLVYIDFIVTAIKNYNQKSTVRSVFTGPTSVSTIVAGYSFSTRTPEARNPRNDHTPMTRAAPVKGQRGLLPMPSRP